MAKKQETSSQMHECRNCHCAVGEGTNVLPFRADGGNDDYETFCPSCFVHVRGPLEPFRWHMRYFAAIRCVHCSTESVAIGTLRCVACGHVTGLLHLPPKTAA